MNEPLPTCGPLLQDSHNQRYFGYLLSFGSNLGNRQKNILKSLTKLAPCCSVRRFSKIIETPPLQNPMYDTSGHAPYLNAVAEIVSIFPPDELYKQIVLIEDEIGHCRQRKWQPRQIDVDILLGCKLATQTDVFAQGMPIFTAQSPEAHIFLPHPELQNRRFLLNLLVDDLRIGKACLQKHGIAFPQ